MNQVATKEFIANAIERSELRMTIRMGAMMVAVVTIILIVLPLLVK